ncbi:type II secretion system protein [Pseudidiomarina marina]|uniref:Type II secretion system protein n=1 Tax=Pseudidiomarina marina TaxID=502366 RepID=A0A432YKT0_9GAMM|nr:hypothetical protein [Pseudidiomarina marina]PHR66428.1 MAG: hypothetical protein COA51_02050 [Idiomarina sp.]RUO61573.1 hypothetical protein CWI76_04835 [Pseudidiomarina marina]
MKRLGFVMLEVITAIVIVSSLLLMINQAWVFKSSQQQRYDWIVDAEQLRLVATDFWAKNGAPPSTMADLFTEREIEQFRLPWLQQWQFAYNAEWLELSVVAPSSAQAGWLAQQIAGAFSRENEFVMPVWQPHAQSATSEIYLHRVEQSEKPYLNAMATELDMGLFDIINVNNLDMQRLTADNVRTDELEATSLKTTELFVTTLYAHDVITPTTSLQEVTDRLAEYVELWKECQLQGKCS